MYISKLETRGFSMIYVYSNRLYTHIYIYIYLYIYVHICAYLYMHIYIYIHINIYICTYMYMQEAAPLISVANYIHMFYVIYVLCTHVWNMEMYYMCIHVIHYILPCTGYWAFAKAWLCACMHIFQDYRYPEICMCIHMHTHAGCRGFSHTYFRKKSKGLTP